MPGSFPKRGPFSAIESAYYDLTERISYIATYRASDVADDAEAIDLYVGNPDGSGVDVLVSVTFSAGGSAHLDTGDNASIDTAGTDLVRQSKGTNGTGTAVIEQGGSYNSDDTLETLIAGSRRSNVPSKASGGDELPDLRLLEPGEAVQYTVTNRSGNEVDFDTVINAAEVSA